MSAIFEVNQSQLNTVLNELTKIESNLADTLPTAVEKYMTDEVWDFAIERTHYISHDLQSGWDVKRDNSGTAIVITLYNRVPYAQKEFDRPGYKEAVGTTHDVRPEISDMVNGNIERVANLALSKGIQK